MIGRVRGDGEGSGEMNWRSHGWSYVRMVICMDSERGGIVGLRRGCGVRSLLVALHTID